MSTLYCLMIDYGPKLRISSREVDPILTRDHIVELIIKGDFDAQGGKGLVQIIEINVSAGRCADVTLSVMRDVVREAEQDGDKLTQQVFDFAQGLRLLPIWATAFENGAPIGFASMSMRETDMAVRQHRLSARELGL